MVNFADNLVRICFLSPFLLEELAEIDCLQRAFLGSHLNNFVEPLFFLHFQLLTALNKPLSSNHAGDHAFLSLLVNPLLIYLAKFLEDLLSQLRHLLEVLKTESEFILETSITF